MSYADTQIEDFEAACMEAAAGTRTPTADVWAAYVAWTEASGRDRLTRDEFWRAMRDTYDFSKLRGVHVLKDHALKTAARAAAEKARRAKVARRYKPGTRGPACCPKCGHALRG